MIFQVPMQSGGQIQQVFQTLQAWGFADALLPFLLLFTLIFAILQKVGLFKKADGSGPDRKINAVLGFVIAALVVIPHITGTYTQAGMIDPVIVILSFLPSAGIILVALLLVLLLTGFMGDVPNSVMYLGLWISLGVLVLVILNTVFPFWDWLPRDPNTIALVVVLLVMGLIIWFITREPGSGEPMGQRVRTFSEGWLNRP